MITKHYLKSRNSCKVTFMLPANHPAQSVTIVGDFNHWDRIATPMRLIEGEYCATVELECGHSYHFRYLIHGKEWKNDETADRYSVNPFGTMNCVVSV